MSDWKKRQVKHDEVLKVRLTHDEKVKLEYIAIDDRMNLSDKIRSLIWEEYKRKRGIK